MPPGRRWETEVLPLPEGRSVRSLHAQSPEHAVLVDTDGDVWATRDGSAHWVTDRPDHTDDPLQWVAPTPLGPVLVARSGAGSVLAWSGKRPEVVPEDSWTPTPGLVDAVGAAGSGLLAIDGEGRLVDQRYRVEHLPGHPCGRPLEVGGRAVTAAVAPGVGWSAPLAPAALPAASRTALAELWRRDAVAEHASIGSFARFVLQLLALGAPAALVAEAQAAMGDEVRHAERCFALASRYAGESLRPEPLPLDGVLGGSVDLASVSVAVLREGAIGESIGALLAVTRWQRATDPEVRAALAEIAEDEGRHARAAWRFLAWAVAEGGAPVRESLRAAVDEAVASHDVAAPEGPVVPGWGAHGGLTAAETRRVVRRAVRGVVRPCVERLLGCRPGPRR